MQRWFAAGMILLCVMSRQSAANSPPCVAPTAFESALRHQIPAAKIAAVVGEDARAFVAAYNELPPPSDVTADIVLVVTVKQAPSAAAVFFRRGCFIGRAMLPRPMLDTLMTMIEKGGA